VTRMALKLYTDFYNSGIISASPVGLRLVLGTLSHVRRSGGKERFCREKVFFINQSIKVSRGR
jgi:hypothetical protein